ncbi:MAG: hypothetical protein K0R17_2943 [Rariglobus sp.]|jgi:hypothetical protein|nr:hypothetical protein [Rariglobus sp.]
MPKIYFIAPLVALALFFAVFLNFKNGHDELKLARAAAIATAKEAKLKSEIEARRQAIEDALRAQEQRKKEREAKEAREKAEKEARQLALDAREKAWREQEKLVRQLDRLKKEVIAEKEELAKRETVKIATLAEQAFLRDFVQKSEASVKKFEEVLVQIDSAERTRAAEATKKKS